MNILDSRIAGRDLFAVVLIVCVLYALSGPTRGSDLKWTIQRPKESQNQGVIESEPGTPDDPQVKAVLDKMALAGISRPSTVDDVRKAYLF